MRQLILLFAILFFIITPVAADEEALQIDVEFPEFYEVNVSGTPHKAVGIVGIGYRGKVIVESPNKEVDLTNRSLEIEFVYTSTSSDNSSTNIPPIFAYNQQPFIRSYSFNDTFDLSKECGRSLNKGESKFFLFNVSFLDTGMYVIQWKEKEDANYRTIFISIVEPIEYENLIKQSQLLDAEKKSAEASEKAADYTRWMAIGTFILAVATIITVIFSFNNLKEIQKENERSKILEEIQVVLTPSAKKLKKEIGVIEKIEKEDFLWNSSYLAWDFSHSLILFFDDRLEDLDLFKSTLEDFPDLKEKFNSHDKLYNKLNELYIKIKSEVITPELKEQLKELKRGFNRSKEDALKLGLTPNQLEWLIGDCIINRRIPKRMKNTIESQPSIVFLEENWDKLLEFRDTPQIKKLDKEIKSELSQLLKLDKELLEELEGTREKYRKRYNFTINEVDPKERNYS